MKAAFTLLELIFVIAVIAVLMAIAIPASNGIAHYTARVKSLSNLRQIGVAAHLYANDHLQQLPGAPPAGDTSSDQWPGLFCAYLSPSDPRVFRDPADPAAAKLPIDQVLSNAVNNTGYVYNGFDELGSAADSTPPAVVPLAMVEHPASTVLMCQKQPKSKDFCVHLLFQPITALLNLLNPAAFNDGAHYLYVDGSVRYLKQSEFSDRSWLLNTGLDIPGPPPLLGLPPLLRSPLLRPALAQN